MVYTITLDFRVKCSHILLAHFLSHVHRQELSSVSGSQRVILSLEFMSHIIHLVLNKVYHNVYSSSYKSYN